MDLRKGHISLQDCRRSLLAVRFNRFLSKRCAGPQNSVYSFIWHDEKNESSLVAFALFVKLSWLAGCRPPERVGDCTAGAISYRFRLKAIQRAVQFSRSVWLFKKIDVNRII